MCAHPPQPSGDLSPLKRLLTAPIRFYKRFISPMTPPSCRFQPTCSSYAVEAIEVWGVYGLWLALRRLLRCHPFHPGGHDPVPRPHTEEAS